MEFTNYFTNYFTNFHKNNYFGYPQSLPDKTLLRLVFKPTLVSGRKAVTFVVVPDSWLIEMDSRLREFPQKKPLA